MNVYDVRCDYHSKSKPYRVKVMANSTEDALFIARKKFDEKHTEDCVFEKAEITNISQVQP